MFFVRITLGLLACFSASNTLTQTPWKDPESISPYIRATNSSNEVLYHLGFFQGSGEGP